MGALFRIFYIAGVAAIGYFANDIGDGITRYVPSAEDKTTGKISWYWMIVVLLVISGLFIWLITLLFPKKYQKS